MKPARVVVLVIVLAAGAITALLVARSDPTLPAAQAPVAQLETLDILMAGADIGMGHTVSAQELRWQSRMAILPTAMRARAVATSTWFITV